MIYRLEIQKIQNEIGLCLSTADTGVTSRQGNHFIGLDPNSSLTFRHCLRSLNILWTKIRPPGIHSSCGSCSCSFCLQSSWPSPTSKEAINLQESIFVHLSRFGNTTQKNILQPIAWSRQETGPTFLQWRQFCTDVGGNRAELLHYVWWDVASGQQIWVGLLKICPISFVRAQTQCHQKDFIWEILSHFPWLSTTVWKFSCMEHWASVDAFPSILDSTPWVVHRLDEQNGLHR